MTDPKVRVRIAPSPTGYLHVGTARAALFNYLYARHTGGQFLVRIEDTDKERSKEEFIQPIIDGLKWLGLDWDNELIYQSKRADFYAEKLAQFVKTDYAYYCFCSKEELGERRKKAMAAKGDTRYDRTCLALSGDEVQARIAAGEKPVVRIKIPDGDVVYDDLLAGTLTRSSNDIEDFIVARSDGSVTYNFAVVMDDHDMSISHVLRGNDHITNTFKQVVLYQAMGYPLPVFCHVPLILRPDKSKVSKRKGDKAVGDYRHEGILPEAMFNYLSLLGWSPKTDRELYSPDELVKMFDIDNLNSANTVFDIDKLLAFNKSYISETSDHDLAALAAPMLVDAGLTTKYWLETRWEYLRQVVGLLKPRLKSIAEIVEQGGYFFEFKGEYEEKAAAKHFTPENAELLEALVGRFEQLTDFTEETADAALTEFAESRDLKKAKIIHPTRLAVSGTSKGPGLYEMLVVLSQSVVLERMKQAIEFIKRKSE
jgi:glutamyl-tRNA synthetase